MTSSTMMHLGRGEKNLNRWVKCSASEATSCPNGGSHFDSIELKHSQQILKRVLGFDVPNLNPWHETIDIKLISETIEVLKNSPRKIDAVNSLKERFLQESITKILKSVSLAPAVFQKPNEIRKTQDLTPIYKAKSIKILHNRLTPDQKEVLNNYSWHGAGLINSSLRNKEDLSKVFLGELTIEAFVSILDEVIALAPNESKIVYRGTSYDAIDSKDLKIGKNIKFREYLSTSSHAKMAGFEHSKGVILEIKTKKGLPLSYVSAVPVESEILLPRGMNFKVVAIYKKVAYFADGPDFNFDYYTGAYKENEVSKDLKTNPVLQNITLVQLEEN